MSFEKIFDLTAGVHDIFYINIEIHSPYEIKEQVDTDQGYGRGGTPVFTDVFEPLAGVTLYLTDENCLGSCFGAA